MSDKAAKKKQYILDTAKGVFAQKGFKNVTMKDIVEACDISRGGLYIYFDSTEDIFEEILKGEEAETDDVFTRSMKDLSAGDMLAMFFKEQKKELLNNKDNLLAAKYEYYFFSKEQGKPSTSYKEKNKAYVQAIAKLLEAGTEAGDFYCDDAVGAAHNILNAIEGLKVRSITTGIDEEDIDNEFIYIMSGLLAE